MLNAASTIGAEELAPGEAVMLGWVEPSEKVEPAEAFDNATLLVVGSITYGDDAGVSRQTGYFRQYDTDAGRLRTIEDPDFEYAD